MIDFTPMERRPSRRSRMEMLCDVLKVVGNGDSRPTRIMQVANLTWNDLLSDLEALMRSGLLMKEGGPKASYRLTAKGRETLNEYLSLKEALAHAEFDAVSGEKMSKALKLQVAAQSNGHLVRALESRLRESGLAIQRNAVAGKSGVQHVFDVVARAKDGSTYGYAMFNDVDESQVLGLFAKQLDTGFGIRAVYTGSVSPAARQLAEAYALRLERWMGEEERKKAGERKGDLVGLSGKKVLFQVDPNFGYESVIRKAVEEFLSSGRRVSCFTWKGSPIYDAVFDTEGLTLYVMASDVAYTTPTEENQYLVPESDHAVLLEEFRKTFARRKDGGVLLIFDSISDMVMLKGVQQTYEFLREMARMATGPDVTVFSVLKLLSQDERTDSLIKGIYTTHVLCDASGLKTTR